MRDVRNNYAGEYRQPNSINANGYLRSTASNFHVHPATNKSHKSDNEMGDNGLRDSASDKSILGGGTKRYSGIEKTTEYSMKYESEVGEMGGETYELQPRGVR